MLVGHDAIGRADIRPLLTSGKNGPSQESQAYAGLPYMEAKHRALADFTSNYLREKLAMHSGHITKAAAESGIPRQHFSLLMKRYLAGQDSESD